MRHIPTVAESAEIMGFNREFSADDYNVAVILAEVVECLKTDPRSGVTVSSKLSREQLSKAMGILLSMVVNHEVAQAEREKVLGQ